MPPEFDREAFEDRRQEIAASDWHTPAKPLAPGEKLLCHNQRGVREWFCHPDLALDSIAHGVLIDGKHVQPELVGEWPAINALQIRCMMTGHDGFVDASQAGI